MVIWLVQASCNIYWWMLLARVLLSYFPENIQYHPLARLVERATEPVLYPIRRQLRRYNTGPFDFSALIAMFGIVIIQSVLVRVLLAMGFH